MEIIDEGAIYEALEGTENFRRKKTGGHFLRSLMMINSNNWMFSLQKSFY